MTATPAAIRQRRTRLRGYTLLPVMLAATLIAAVAFLVNRDNGAQAHMIATQAGIDRARYAAEAGLQAVNYEVQRLGCGGGYPTAAAPVVNAQFAGAAYSAYASQPSGFPLVLTATGTYDGATVTLSRSDVLVFQSPLKSLTLQPGGASGLDTHLNAKQATRNYGADTNLWLWDGRYEVLLKFDLASVPAGSRVVPWHDGSALQPGATLSLYQTNSPSSPGGTIALYLVTRSWTEGTGAQPSDGATWDTYDGASAWPSPEMGYDAKPLVAGPYVAAAGWKSWDVTDTAAAWMSGVYANHGIRLRSSAGAVNSVQFTSSDDNNAVQRPKLALTYLAPCGASTTTTLTLAPGADAYIDDDDNYWWRNYGSSNRLRVYQSSSRTNRALLKFDVSAIPTGATILSARLRLSASATQFATGYPKTISAYALTESWVEGTLNGSNSFPDGVTYYGRDSSTLWTAAGGTYRTPGAALATEESTEASPPPGGFRSGWLYWDLTALVDGWVSGAAANHGVILISTVPDQPVIDSREGLDATTRPQLVVTYR